jgi:hypothetical protein
MGEKWCTEFPSWWFDARLGLSPMASYRVNAETSDMSGKFWSITELAFIMCGKQGGR